MKPFSNLFIAGAPKSGSTFLYQKLKKHPDLFFPKIKELNHFSYSEILNLGSYYKDYKIKDTKKYLGFYKNSNGEKYLADCSISYFTFPEVPKKIKEFNPASKFIFILRNPVQRAFSHYNMDTRMGYASLAFKDYIRDKHQYPVHYHQYIENSMYFKHINKYIKVFGEEKVCVLLLENMEQDISKLFEFLAIPQYVLEMDTSEKVNPNKNPKNFISKTLQKNRKLTSQIKMIVPQTFLKPFKGLFYEETEKKELKEEDRQTLEKLFEKDRSQLQSILDVNLNDFWKI